MIAPTAEFAATSILCVIQVALLTILLSPKRFGVMTLPDDAAGKFGAMVQMSLGLECQCEGTKQLHVNPDLQLRPLRNCAKKLVPT